MKKFEPHYRLVRYGQASKIEKASRQQREYNASLHRLGRASVRCWEIVQVGLTKVAHRQAAQEPLEGVPGYGEGYWQEGEEGQIEVCCRFGGCRRYWWRHLLLLHASSAVASVFIALGGRLSWCSYIECDQNFERRFHLTVGPRHRRFAESQESAGPSEKDLPLQKI